MQTYNSAIFILADGARPDVFEEKLASGDLPNIARYLKEPGAYRRATTVFPSTTGPAYLPFLTGCYPGRCNVPGIRWFDRKEYARSVFSTKRFRSYVGLSSFMMNHDLDPKIPTLFEMVERPLNIFSSINRGAGFFGNRSKLNRIFYFYYAHLTDRWGFVDQAATDKLVKGLDSNPDYSFVVFPAIDEYAHLSSPFSEATQKAYVELDRLVGEIVTKLKALGRLDETLLMISSDHGLSATHKHFGVDRFLEQKGMKTFYYPLILKRNFSAATMVSGNGMCHVYVRPEESVIRGRDGWTEKLSFEDCSRINGNLPLELAEREEIDFVAGRAEDGSIVILSKKGQGRIYRNNDNYTYLAEKGDPLFSNTFPTQALTAEESLRHTFDTDYPDGLVQLEQIFHSPRTGDLVISAKPGFDLRDRFESPEHRASHGSLHREHMQVPVFSSAPLQAGPMRTVDVFPTLLSYMGIEHHHTIDGLNRRG